MLNIRTRELIIERLLVTVMSMLESLFLALPIGILVMLICLGIIEIYQKRKGIIIKRRKRNAIIIFCAYIIVVIQMSILFRPFGTINEIDLIPFNTPGGARFIILYALANMVIFFPVGILVPRIFKKANDVKVVSLAGFLLSLFIEISQLTLQCGVFQTEDLIVNTMGAGIGYYIVKKLH